MSERLELHTLGGLTICRAGMPVTGFDSRKGPALLVYLASTRRPHSREVLAEMLWEERTQAQALANLRVALTSLRQTVEPFVEITRDTVALRPEADIWLDTFEAEQAVTQAESTSADGLSATQVIALLESARALYQGDFLEGFYVESRAFNDWAMLERERLRFGIMYVLDRLVEEYTRQGDTRAGLDSTTRLAQIDPLREKTYRQAMRLLVQSGQREAAMHQFELCQRTLREELGVSPGADTVELYERIRSGQNFVPPPDPSDPHQVRPKRRLPVLATSFVGREVEVAALLDRLDDPECRLLTVVGAGGIGKTRLALEVARCAASCFADGVGFVQLNPVHNGDAIAPAFITALGLQVPDGQHDLRACLLAELADKALLLVLDNMEHLVGQLDLLEALLTEAPQIKLLVTSRQPLALGWEWVFALDGLPVPDDPDAGQLETYGGVRLFIERARRVQHTFALAHDPAGVIRICQMVEGMPLGIELAASWLRVMSCGEIATQLVDLPTPYQAGEARHQSLRALFENTWERLSAHEQHLLMALTVFRGGFASAAATAVTGITLPELAALVHKSLVTLSYQRNRYYIHQLLKEFLGEKLHEQPAAEQEVLDRHSAYFLDLLIEREADLRGGQPQRALDELLTEINNGRAALQHTLEQRRFDVLVRCSTALGAFYTLRALHHEGLAFFQQALDALRAEPETPERDTQELALQSCLITPLIAVYGWEDHQLWPVAERIRELSARLGDDQQTLANMIMLVNLYINEEFERAIEVGEAAVALAQRIGREAQNVAHVALQVPYICVGQHARGLEHARTAMARFDPNDCLWGTMIYGMDPLVTSLTHAGFALNYLGYAEQAVQSLSAARERAETLEHPFSLALAWNFVAHSALITRETRAGRAATQVLLEISSRHGFHHWLACGPVFLAVILVQEGEYAGGIAALLVAIQKEREAGLYHVLALGYAHLGYAYAKTGRLEQGFAEIEQGIALLGRTGERHHEPVLHRFRGELLLMRGDETGAATSFEQAIAVAQRQESRFYELQATLSLCRLMQRQGRGAEARARLQPLYDWFTEGFDRPDLVEARALLAELG